MPLSSQPLWSRLRFRAPAVLALLVALVPTLIAYWRVEKNVEAHDAARFEAVTSGVKEAVREQLERYLADLRAISSLFEANNLVRPREWDTFIDAMEFGRRHPGVRSVCYAEKILPDELSRFNRAMWTQQGPDFQIFPDTTNEIKFPAVQIRQFPTNIDAQLGFDSYAEPERREALDTLLRTRQPTVTRKMVYWKDGQRGVEGFTVFVPVPGKDGAVRGVILSSFVPQHFFAALAERQVEHAISVEMFDNTEARSGSLLASIGNPAQHLRPAFRTSVPVRLLDQTFLLSFASRPDFEAASDKYLPRLVLAGGLVFSLFLFGITWMQGSARAAADRLNRRLRESEERLLATNGDLEIKIAESIRTEGLLAHERELLRSLLEHSPDTVYFKDRESRFIKCSRAVHGHLGLHSSEEAVGKTDFDFFTEEHARPAFEMEQEIMRTGHPVIGLVEKETWHDGRETWVLTSKLPLRDKHGNIIGTFGITKDITKLKAVELALEKEKEMLGVTLRSIGDGVITTDVRGRIVLFNQVAERLTGWTAAEAAGRPLKEVFRVGSSGTVESNTDILHRILDGAAPPAARDAVLMARDESERHVSQCFAPIIDHAGQNIGAVLVFRDITEKLKTEAELLKASKLESIGALAGGLAHDFNNVLTVILGHISLARLATSLGRPADDSLAEAEKASLRARELTQRLLTFARGGAPIKKPLDLAPLVRDCAARALQGVEITPDFFIGQGLWAVEADESQIGQVLHNLIHFSRASLGQNPRLAIHVLNQEVETDPLLFLKAGRYVRVSIRDYGAGLPAENLTKIFEPYFGPKRHGSGLELATAYSIVRKHDGQIRVESIAGQGTLFHVYLPATDVLPAPVRAIASAPRRARLAARRVLVMDDEPPIRRLAELMLAHLGCTAVTAADGAEAIQLYEAARKNGEPFDAVVMDLTVPHGLGGKETIRQLKALDPSVRAIVSSGYSHDPVMANFREYGFSGVVPKPYSRDDLAAALDELMEREAGGDPIQAV